MGDHSAQQEGYVQQCRLLVRQTPKLEEKIEEIHSSLAGTTTPQAETHFLKKAATLDTYGVDPHPVKVTLQLVRKKKKNIYIYIFLKFMQKFFFQNLIYMFICRNQGTEFGVIFMHPRSPGRHIGIDG